MIIVFTFRERFLKSLSMKKFLFVLVILSFLLEGVWAQESWAKRHLIDIKENNLPSISYFDSNAQIGRTFDLFKALREENPSANVAFSPFLVNWAFHFICENSVGEVKKEIEPFVGATSLPKKEKVFDFSHLANYRNDLTLIDDIKKCGFSFAPTTFKNPLEVLRLVLNSKLKAKWQKEFEAIATKKGRFGSDEFGYFEVDFMNRDDKQSKYADVGDFKVVSLPFLNSDYDMLFFKRNAGKSLNDFDIEDFKLAVKRTKYAFNHVIISIPKFKIKSDLDLIEPLKNLGIKRAFDYSNDYKFFKEEMQIRCDKFTSETEVEIDEKGVIATLEVVVSMVTLGVSNAVDLPIYFYLNEPFIYVIYNRKTSQILYIGQIVKF